MNTLILLFLLVLCLVSSLEERRDQYMMSRAEYRYFGGWKHNFYLRNITYISQREKNPVLFELPMDFTPWSTALHARNPLTGEELFAVYNWHQWYVYSFDDSRVRLVSWEYNAPFAYDKERFEVLAFDKSAGDRDRVVMRYSVLKGKALGAAIDLTQFFNMSTRNAPYEADDLAMDEVTGFLYILISVYHPMERKYYQQIWQWNFGTEDYLVVYDAYPNTGNTPVSGREFNRIYVYNNTIAAQSKKDLWVMFNMSSAWFEVSRPSSTGSLIVTVHLGEQNMIITGESVNAESKVFIHAVTFSHHENNTISTNTNRINYYSGLRFIHLFPSDCKDFCNLGGFCNNGICECDRFHYGEHCETYCEVPNGYCTESGEPRCNIGYARTISQIPELICKLVPPPVLSPLPPIYEISRLHDGIEELVYVEDKSGVLITRQNWKMYYDTKYEIALIFDEQHCDHITYKIPAYLLRNTELPKTSMMIDKVEIYGVPANVWHFNGRGFNSWMNRSYTVSRRNESWFSGYIVDRYVSTEGGVLTNITYNFTSFLPRQNTFNFSIPGHCLACFQNKSRCSRPVETTEEESTTEEISITTGFVSTTEEISITTRFVSTTEEESTTVETSITTGFISETVTTEDVSFETQNTKSTEDSSDEIMTDQTQDDPTIWQIISLIAIALIVIMLVIMVGMGIKLKSAGHKYISLNEK